jgi:hypothetical protein
MLYLYVLYYNQMNLDEVAPKADQGKVSQILQPPSVVSILIKFSLLFSRIIIGVDSLQSETIRQFECQIVR